MERYVLFTDSSTAFYLLPVRHFMGGKYNTSTLLDLYFEKAPLSYKVSLTVNANKGEEVLKSIAELFDTSSEPVIVFSDIDSRYDVPNVTAISAVVKIVTK